MNILIPMAGKGIRFKNKYNLPKPLIKINDKPMIEWAVSTLGIDGNFIFIILKEHDLKYNLKYNLKNKYPNSNIIICDEVTEGPACTALLAKKFINNNEELIITNCDQIMTWEKCDFINFININSKIDGCVVTYFSDFKNNSYAKIDQDNNVVEIAEKKVISKYSLNGIHYWKKGKYFVDSAEEMIRNNDRTNNEFYIAPSYNYLIKDNKIIKIYHINNNFHNSVGSPEDLDIFLRKLNDNKKD